MQLVFDCFRVYVSWTFVLCHMVCVMEDDVQFFIVL